LIIDMDGMCMNNL